MRDQTVKKAAKPEVIDTRHVRCRSGKEYVVPVTAYYDDAGVMNVEFHWPAAIDDGDASECHDWQDAYVNRLGRRVA